MGLIVSVDAVMLPPLSRLLGRRFQVEFSGSVVTELAHHIANFHSGGAGPVLLDENGQIKEIIQVRINDESFLAREEYNTRLLENGDNVQFLLLMGGG